MTHYEAQIAAAYDYWLQVLTKDDRLAITDKVEPSTGDTPDTYFIKCLEYLYTNREIDIVQYQVELLSRSL